MGNSSAGVREAPAYCIPTINIGTRQFNRFECDSIVNVAEDTSAIVDAIENLPKTEKSVIHFGDGKSADRFIEFLNNKSTWEISSQKRFVDILK